MDDAQLIPKTIESHTAFGISESMRLKKQDWLDYILYNHLNMYALRQLGQFTVLPLYYKMLIQ